MNTAKASANASGIGFVGLLQIVFIVLKLLGKITWKWVWVLAPAWIYAGLIAVLLLIALIIAILE